jgi:hypothetical protein
MDMEGLRVYDWLFLIPPLSLSTRPIRKASRRATSFDICGLISDSVRAVRYEQAVQPRKSVKCGTDSLMSPLTTEVNVRCRSVLGNRQLSIRPLSV